MSVVCINLWLRLLCSFGSGWSGLRFPSASSYLPGRKWVWYIYTPKNKHDNRKTTIWRCISCQKSWMSIVILVFGGVVVAIDSETNQAIKFDKADGFIKVFAPVSNLYETDRLGIYKSLRSDVYECKLWKGKLLLTNCWSETCRYHGNLMGPPNANPPPPLGKIIPLDLHRMQLPFLYETS